MYEKKIPERYECGISIAMKVLGGKWKSLIIEYIHRGVRRPSELHRTVDQANPRVINMALKELEDYGIVTKTVYPGLPLKVEYFLTRLGESILPVLDAMEQWGNKHREEIVPDYSMPDKPPCAGIPPLLTNFEFSGKLE
ncbi:winged helix-turn-helix transcriptional regulator [Pseudobacter ginsenosidimutans]|uniref:HxlR family transcriptional regulator n=1 Tax=Pseudobacter ginsenosidimutans TaxID=661488 RepID=A0A4Q7MUD0_9BACT|nr:helix-turn-helix domain-containing protein [Pseudobacter ginsenosidimutans]QEC42487.1 helix-turn-helix transcriptional regulator [Pseudobacter ginsenosidimutans]RZS70660.1 HxlR family transcriptional regulator [Pseudobacter ginsenosidimutans]